MAIYRFLQNAAFMPEDVNRIVEAFEDASRALRLSDQTDPLLEVLAKKIIEIAQTGVRDSAQISRLALRAIGRASE